MNAVTIGLLITVGVVAAVLLQEIRRVERRLGETINNLQRAGERIASLEKEVSVLRKR